MAICEARPGVKISGQGTVQPPPPAVEEAPNPETVSDLGIEQGVPEPVLKLEQSAPEVVAVDQAEPAKASKEEQGGPKPKAKSEKKPS